MWVLYIIGGIMLLAILNEIGLIPEFIGMVALALVSGMISGLVALIFGGRFDSWFNIGILIGLAIFFCFCTVFLELLIQIQLLRCIRMEHIKCFQNVGMV